MNNMSTQKMINELRRLQNKHKMDFVYTGDIRWSDLCRDVANRLETLYNTTSMIEFVNIANNNLDELIELSKSKEQNNEELIYRTTLMFTKRYINELVLEIEKKGTTNDNDRTNQED